MTERTPYGMIAAFDVVTDDLALLMRDLTARVAELTQGWPDRLDDLTNAALPPSDTGELGYDRRDDGRLSITIGFGDALFDDRFGLADKKPPALKKMPSFPVDNLDPERTHGDIVILVQSDHMMVTHHAMRDIMRRTKGRLEGRWCQACFQRIDEHKEGRPKIAAHRGLLGFPDGSQNISPKTDDELIWTGREVPAWARGGTYLAARLIRLKIERWDRLSMTAQDDSIGRRKLSGSPLEGGGEQSTPELGARPRATPTSAWPTRAPPAAEKRRFLRRGFVYNDGFDEYGLLDSGSVFLAFCRDVQEQFEATKRNMIGQDLDEYAVAIGGGYFYVPARRQRRRRLPGPPAGGEVVKRGRRLRGLGRAGLERVQRGQAVLDRLPGDGAAGGRAAGPGAGRRRWAGRSSAPWPWPSRCRGSRSRCAAGRCCGWPSPLDPAAGALARARAAGRRPGRLGVLHRLLLGLALLPPAHRRAVDQLHPLLAAGGHQLGPHQRQHARAGAEDGHGAQRRHAAGRGARPVRAPPRSPSAWPWPARWAWWPGAASTATCCPSYPARFDRAPRSQRRAAPAAST